MVRTSRNTVPATGNLKARQLRPSPAVMTGLLSLAFLGGAVASALAATPAASASPAKSLASGPSAVTPSAPAVKSSAPDKRLLPARRSTPVTPAVEPAPDPDCQQWRDLTRPVDDDSEG